MRDYPAKIIMTICLFKIPENTRVAGIIIHEFGMGIIYQYFFITSTVGGEWIYQCSQAKSIKSIEYG